MNKFKQILLDINNAYLFFGTTIYVGVLWSMHFFWYPSWKAMNLENAKPFFVDTTTNATKFFWIVVPLMMLTNAIMIISEWKTRHKWPAIIALLCQCGASYVGQGLIIPINKTIAAGLPSNEALTSLLMQWMQYNDIRWVIMTIMWVTLMYFFISKRNA